MNVMRPVSGKILEHTEGLGVPSAITVDQRAEEIALIEGRETFHDGDWRQAYLELHGGHHYPLESVDLYGGDELSTLTAAVAVPSIGHQTPRIEFEGAQNIGEELIAEGLDEALHDRMLSARLDIDIPENEQFAD